MLAFSAPHRITEFMDESGHWHRGKTYLSRYLEGLASISDTSILAVGGAHTPNKATTSLNDVTEYDVQSGTQANRFKVTCKMFGTTCSTCISNNGVRMVLCLGGTCLSAQPQVQNMVFVYHLETGAWVEMPDWKFPEKIRFANLAWFQGKLYVLGALYEFSDKNIVYQFDETKEPVWTVVDILPYQLWEYSNVRIFNRSLLVL